MKMYKYMYNRERERELQGWRSIASVYPALPSEGGSAGLGGRLAPTGVGGAMVGTDVPGVCQGLDGRGAVCQGH